jgi:hypothetical protein
MTCCRDDSAYDYTCDYCSKRLGRDQELFLLPNEGGDKIFCSNQCKECWDNIVSPISSLSYSSGHIDRD